MNRHFYWLIVRQLYVKIVLEGRSKRIIVHFFALVFTLIEHQNQPPQTHKKSETAENFIDF
nr:MAG TPA: hypothetical protein [Caudoviricetes sp.]